MRTDYYIRRKLMKGIVSLGISTTILMTAAPFTVINVRAKENDPLPVNSQLNNCQDIKVQKNDIYSLSEDDYAYEFEYNGRKYLYSELKFIQSQNYTYFILDNDKKEISITKIINAEGEVIIPSELDGYKVIGLGAPLHSFAGYEEGLYEPKSQYSIFDKEDMNKVTSLVIPEGITQIGIATFKDMTSLKKVSLPNSLLTIGIEAFYNSGIEELVLPENLELIDMCAFYGCKALKKVTVHSSKVRGGGEYPSFKACHNLELVTWGNVEFANVDLFDLSKIKRVVIPSSVKSFEMVGCNVETLVIMGKDTNFITDKELAPLYWNEKFSIMLPEGSVAINTMKGLKVRYDIISLPKTFTIRKSKMTSNNSQKIKLAWNKQSNITKYQIYYSETENGNYQLLKETNQTTYTTTKLNGYVKIRSYKTYKGVRWYSEYSQVKL